MNIRPAVDGDIDKIVRLETACLPADAWSESSVRASVADADCVTLVADVTGVIVGYVTGRKIPPEAELYRICVSPDMRRQGVARHLADAFHASLRDAGCDTCFLEVRASNTAAQSLYREAGYTVCGTRPRYYRDPTEDAILEVIRF